MKTELERSSAGEAESRGIIDAIYRVQAVIEFELDGTILFANENFLKVMGYTLDEIRGRHHSMFIEPGTKDTAGYKQFWKKLGSGQFDSGEYKRYGKGGKEVWLQAAYNPIFDADGKLVKVVKFATDITAQRLANANYQSQIAAISKSQAVIEFGLDGTIITANDNFLNVMGYTLREIQGKHHSMFAAPGVKESAEYRQFWQKLGRGEFDSGEYKRISKGGKEVWLQASYNPIFDLNNRPYKIVKYAADITAQKQLQHTIARVLRETSEVMDSLAQGDLTRTITGKYEGEFALLSNSVNGLIQHLRKTVSEIVSSANAIASASNEIANGNSDLSQRTEEQASSLEETASTMEEMTGAVKQSANNAHHAATLATTAKVKAEKGGQVVSHAIHAMEEINKSSKEIADIISVIDEIAFQTNLLALNAAVEAARAGEQGRGFAVVAGEVRNLAQRSAAAAKQIKSLIKDSVDKVSEGARLVDESGKTLGEIVAAVEKVNDIISEIAAAAKEQSSGIEQVNKAVMQMDQMTQQNAALVEEAAAASESMNNDAYSMSEMMKFFKLG